MKRLPHVLIVLWLGAILAIQMGCTTPQPANSNKPSVNANTPPSNSSQTKPASQPGNSTTGSIEVTSVPPGAHVLLIATDEDSAGEPQSKGSTPTMVSGVQPGKYTVNLEKPGYKVFQKEIVVKKGGNAQVNATLRKK